MMGVLFKLQRMVLSRLYPAYLPLLLAATFINIFLNYFILTVHLVGGKAGGGPNFFRTSRR